MIVIMITHKMFNSNFHDYINDPTEDFEQSITMHHIIQAIPHKLKCATLKTAVEHVHNNICLTLIPFIGRKDYVYGSELFINAIKHKCSNEVIKKIYDTLPLHPFYKKNLPLKTAIKYDNLYILKILLAHPKVKSKLCSNMLNDCYIQNETYVYFVFHNGSYDMNIKEALFLAVRDNDIGLTYHFLDCSRWSLDIYKSVKRAISNNNMHNFKLIEDFFIIHKKKMDLIEMGFIETCCNLSDTHYELIKYIIDSDILTYKLSDSIALYIMLTWIMDKYKNMPHIMNILIDKNIIDLTIANQSVTYLSEGRSVWNLLYSYHHRSFYIDYTTYGKIVYEINYYYRFNAKDLKENYKNKHNLLDNILYYLNINKDINKDINKNMDNKVCYPINDHFRQFLSNCPPDKNLDKDDIIKVFIKNPKVTQSYNQMLTLLASKTIIFNQTAIPPELINQLVSYIYEIP